MVSFNCVFLQVTFAFTGISLHNISFSYEHVGSLPQALHCARKALRILLANMPPGHGHIQLAESRVLHLESLMHESAFPPDFSETCVTCVTDEATTAHAWQAVSDHSRLPVTPMYFYSPNMTHGVPFRGDHQVLCKTGFGVVF